jgi:hypothetical protein
MKATLLFLLFWGNYEEQYSNVNFKSNCSETSVILVWKDNVNIDKIVVPPDQSVDKKLFHGWYWFEIYTLGKPTESRSTDKTPPVKTRSSIKITKKGISVHVVDFVRIILNCPIQA